MQHRFHISCSVQSKLTDRAVGFRVLLTILNCPLYRTQCCNMSWDSYIDNLIAQAKDSSGTSHVDRGSIIGMDGGANWTTFSNPQYIKVSCLGVVVL